MFGKRNLAKNWLSIPIVFFTFFIMTFIGCVDEETPVTNTKSSAKSITAFVINGVSGVINENTKTISVTVPNGINITNITPIVTVSAKADYSPKTAQNFTTQKTYTVTAEDGTTQKYSVTVTVAPPNNQQSSAKSITAFSINGVQGIINENTKTISVTVPNGTDITAITPVITVSAKADYSPKTVQNFTTQKTYTVTAEDGSTQNYTVTVTVAQPTYAYTVTFHMNGGETEANPKTKTVISPATTIDNLPTEPKRNGYNFIEWNTQINGEGTSFNKNTTVSSNITVYAKWLKNFTVTFETNGGSLEFIEQIVADGNRISMPIISKVGFNAEGWYKEADFTNIWDFNNDVVTSNIILYVKWGPSIIVPGSTLFDQLQWLENNVKSGFDYTIEIESNVTISPKYLSYNNKSNINLTMKGIGENRIISLSGNGSMFTIRSGVTLILDNMVELRGKSNTSPLIQIDSEGKFILKNGARIADNSNPGVYYSFSGYTYSHGGGVNVASNGIFIMDGGEITRNTTACSSDYQSFSRGGGVYIASNGTFIMNGGKIFGNTASSSSTYYYYTSELSSWCDSSSYGGGVFVETNGSFIMNNGEIYSNTALSSYSPSKKPSSYSSRNYVAYANTYGGGVYVGGNFTMNGGKIAANEAKSLLPYSQYFYHDVISYGGGVYLSGNFTMNDGEISNNIISASNGDGPNSTIKSDGKEFFIKNGGVFTKTGGTILNY